MKKVLICLLISLVFCGCGKITKETELKEEKTDYKNLKSITIDGINIRTMLDITNDNDITEYIESKTKNTYRFIYKDGSITEEDYKNLIQYLYDECYGYDSYLGVININEDIGNYEIFYKKSKTDGKAVKVEIKESIKDSKSIYEISYSLVDYDGDVIYTRYIGNNNGVEQYDYDESCVSK